jgi:SAM-dependent methyltransferase
MKGLVKGMKCLACNNEEWLTLCDPHPTRSITTSGMLVPEPLGKSQCSDCGMVQRTRKPFLGLTDFYEKNYALYYDRPGTLQFNRTRYRQIAEWVAAAVSIPPKRILEVGSGRGWAMAEMSTLFPGAVVQGVEPALENSEAARSLGLDVFTGRLEEFPADGEGFDLIYSNHVIQHVVDPVAFMAQHRALLRKDGIAVITVQDARLLTNELLYSDQNYSFLPAHLLPLAEKGGLVLAGLTLAPHEIEGIRHSQMAVLGRSGSCMSSGAIPGSPSLRALYADRQKYLTAWQSLDQVLVEAISESVRVFNFGAGMYSFLLACYCPNYWARVAACLVDGQSAEFFGKTVADPASISFMKGDHIVLGTRPSAQSDLARRLAMLGPKVTRFDDRIAA